MKKLFKDITEGLIKQGYKILGGNDTYFSILSKDGNTIKVFADNYEESKDENTIKVFVDNYEESNYFIVRYSVRKESKDES